MSDRSADDWGFLILANLKRCAEADLLPRDLFSQVESEATAWIAAHDRRPGFDDDGHPIHILQRLGGGISQRQLVEEFDGEYPGGLSIARVVTSSTLTAYYLDAVIPKSDPHADHSVDSDRRADADRAPEFAAPILVPEGDPWPLPFKPTITLCDVGGNGFVTDLLVWRQLEQTESGGLADLAVEALGLPYGPGTDLVLISIDAAAMESAHKLRRPTILDATEQPWWLCWPEDPRHKGHAVRLRELDNGRLVRGAPEWVICDQGIETASGLVKRQALGTTTISGSLTDREGRARWATFVGMVISAS